MTSQITKDFQMKSKLRKLADGGSPDPSILGTGAAARAGRLLAGRGRQIDDAVDAATGAPAPAPQQVAQAPKKSGLRSMLGLADGGTYLDDAYNTNVYQQSQLKDGGRVNGPGGRTDDKVGPVMLSDEEYVLPGDTADAIGRDKLDAIRLATHEFKDERKESALRKRADGGDGWYDDMMPMDHLADGGNPRIVDSKGTVRTPAAPAAPATPISRVYNAGKVVGRVTGTVGRAVGSTAITAPIAGFGDYKVDTGGIDTSAGGTLGYLAKGEFGNAGASLSGGANEILADSGRGFAKTADSMAELIGAEPDLTGKFDNMIKDKLGGYLTLRNPESSSGETMGPPESAKGPVAAATSALRSDQGPALPVEPGSRMPPAAQVADAVTDVTPKTPWTRTGNMAERALRMATSTGVYGRLGRGVAGALSGEDFATGFMGPSDRDQYLQQRTQQMMGAGAPSAAQPSPVAAASSALRSDQGPAQPVTPGSYQSRRLSEMGVPLDVQNSKPVVDSVGNNTRDFLRTGGTSQYQNLGMYGGNGNIYGKADDPSRPGRINNFVGVGAGASPSNEVGNTVQSPATAAITSALRGLGSGSSAPGAPSSGGGGGVSVIGGGEDRYDKLAKELRGMYSAKGQGNLAKKLVELEQLRANEQGNIRSNETSRANAQLSSDTSMRNTDVGARTNMIEALSRMETARGLLTQQAQAAQLKYLQDARAQSEKLMEDNVKVFESVADTFAAGDKDKQSQYRELLSTLPPEIHATAQGLAPEDKRAFYTNIVRQQLGRSEGLVLGRDVGATAQNAAIGGLIGRMTRFGNGAGGKAVDRALGKIPRVGPALSALRPAENLARFGTLIGAAGGAYATPEVEDLTRWDPVARDPETGAALPAREDIREAATYGAFDTYLNPFDDSVQTVSGRRTNKPTPDEEEAARRFHSALRN